MIASGTIEGLWNKNYNCCPQETYLRYLTLWVFSFGVKLGVYMRRRYENEPPESIFCVIFAIFYEIRDCHVTVMSLVEILIKLELISTELRSFQLI